MDCFILKHVLFYFIIGTWALVVEFKDRDIERFTLKFRNEEQLKLWEATLNKTKAAYRTHVPNTH